MYSKKKAFWLSILKVLLSTGFLVMNVNGSSANMLMKDIVFIIGQAIFLLICNYFLVMFAGIFWSTL